MLLDWKETEALVLKGGEKVEKGFLDLREDSQKWLGFILSNSGVFLEYEGEYLI